MTGRFMDFRKKEIISVTNGVKIGYVDDVVFDTQTAQVLSVVVYGRARFFGLFGREEDILIPWEDIEVVGEDTVLVKNEDAFLPKKTARASYFDKLFG